LNEVKNPISVFSYRSHWFLHQEGHGSYRKEYGPLFLPGGGKRLLDTWPKVWYPTGCKVNPIPTSYYKVKHSVLMKPKNVAFISRLLSSSLSNSSDSCPHKPFQKQKLSQRGEASDHERFLTCISDSSICRSNTKHR